jgi:predicted MFS family arabinose efflux permease
MGLYSMTFNLAFGAGPWLGAMVLAELGGTALWVACLLAGVLAAAMMAHIPDPAYRVTP